MRRAWVLNAVAVVVAAMALVVSIVALMAVRGAATPGESDETEINLLDRAEFTIDLVFDAVERYDEEGRETTLSYHNSPESVQGRW